MFRFPYGNLHGLNLDWLIDQWKKFQNSFTGSFTASSETIAVTDPPDVNVTYDQNTGIYDFHFGIPTQVKPSGFLIGYQEGTSGTTIPTGTWLANPPAVAQGNYLWTKTQVVYNDGQTSTTYAVSRMGVDGAGSPATIMPLMDGVGAVGTSLMFAREDHVHPSDTSKANTTDIPTKTAISVSSVLTGVTIDAEKYGNVIDINVETASSVSLSAGWNQLGTLDSDRPSSAIDILAVDNNANTQAETPIAMRISPNGNISVYMYSAKSVKPCGTISYIQ